jgi:hypothetical protein
MKILLLSTLLSFTYFVQAQKINNSVICSGGDFMSKDTISLEWTLGDFISDQFTNKTTGVNLSSGFQFDNKVIDICGGNCYSISGLVHTNDSLLKEGLVILLDSLNKVNYKLEIKNGEFTFEQVFPGKYTFLAIPSGADSKRYTPTYYVNRLNAETAHFIRVKSTISGIDIYLLKQETSTFSLSENFRYTTYPNPATSYIIVSNKYYNWATELSIFNIEGIKVISKKNIQKMNTVEINTEVLKSGIYNIQLVGESQIQNLKFIKN